MPRPTLYAHTPRSTGPDNGGGIRNERRLLQWAATRATSNIHRNGHGVKKCLAKWAPDYETASRRIRWRIANRNLQSTCSPFRGYAPDVVIDDEGQDATSLAPSGCEVSVEFDAGATLRHLHAPVELCAALKELIQSRYDERTLARTEFVLLVSDGGASIRMSSRDAKFDHLMCLAARAPRHRYTPNPLWT